MSATTIIAALQAKNLAVSGVTSAPTALPGSLSGVRLPVSLIVPGPAQHHPTRVGATHTVREYQMRFYVTPIAQGEGYHGGHTSLVTVLDAVVAAYIATPSVTGGRMQQRFSDTGHEIMEYAGIAYHGFTVTVTIEE